LVRTKVVDSKIGNEKDQIYGEKRNNQREGK